uniref:Uncharacterized protein n=1 Tax=Pseudochlorodesmis sp. HV01306a TaxID=2358488 RepID=A0A386AY00_9CHLO|nr:hypothetical protein [Pseudochlorodesmis sp. HV01306a]
MNSICVGHIGNFCFVNGYFVGLICSNKVHPEGMLKFDPTEEDTPAWGAVGALIELLQIYKLYEKKPNKKILIGIEERLILCYKLRKSYRLSTQMSRQLDEIYEFTDTIYTKIEKKITLRKPGIYGIELIFSCKSPKIQAFKLLQSQKFSRSKLFYLRQRIGKAAFGLKLKKMPKKLSEN